MWLLIALDIFSRKIKMKILKLIVLINLSQVIPAFSQNLVDFDETVIQAPKIDSDEESLNGLLCRTRDHLRWDVCYNVLPSNEERMKSFKFQNSGENKIVQRSGFGIGRDYEFMFEGFARSDVGLLVWDAADEVESHAHLKIMMFFPRLVLPAIRYISNDDIDQVIVTLPTKEEVIFDGKSKEVISGVITEGPQAQDSEGYTLNPEVNYKGSGVVIEADANGNYPVGINSSNKSKFATIKKHGYKDCKIPVKDLWYTDNNKGGNVLFNKKFTTDKPLDSYLKRKCHFSIF
jgi:hypothetical protein